MSQLDALVQEKKRLKEQYRQVTTAMVRRTKAGVQLEEGNPYNDSPLEELAALKQAISDKRLALKQQIRALTPVAAVEGLDLAALEALPSEELAAVAHQMATDHDALVQASRAKVRAVRQLLGKKAAEQKVSRLLAKLSPEELADLRSKLQTVSPQGVPSAEAAGKPGAKQ